jgi:hypothetical protein
MAKVCRNRFTEEEAIKSLNKLQMQNDLRDFIQEFSTLLRKVNVGIAMQKSWFVKALLPYLRQNLLDIQRKTLEDSIQDTYKIQNKQNMKIKKPIFYERTIIKISRHSVPKQ